MFVKQMVRVTKQGFEVRDNERKKIQCECRMDNQEGGRNKEKIDA